MGCSLLADSLHWFQEHVLLGNKKDGTSGALRPWVTLGVSARGANGKGNML